MEDAFGAAAANRHAQAPATSATRTAMHTVGQYPNVNVRHTLAGRVSSVALTLLMGYLPKALCLPLQPVDGQLLPKATKSARLAKQTLFKLRSRDGGGEALVLATSLRRRLGRHRAELMIHVLVDQQVVDSV